MSISFDAGTVCARFMTGTAIVATAVLGGSALASAAPAPLAPPGDNGTVKIHSPSTPEEDNRNVPKVCDFQIVAFGFDAVEEVTWEIVAQGGGNPHDAEPVLDGTLVLDDEGEGSTELLDLENGHYHLNWTFEGENGEAKQKVFKVVCEDEEPEPSEEPSEQPSEEPSEEPSEQPSEEPTEEPTTDPTEPGTEPSEEPSEPTDESSDPAETDAPTVPADESGTPGGLPVTGSALAALVAAGAVAVAGGGAAVFYTRKRRDTSADDDGSAEG
ncbi:LPXTG cell wall anchor domain-containing protein [Nocardiopsis sp. YSL2]|uniref:LPXTG cell wall anchor domain-containing protein n=1 Tax=Nocardiopsis sp. YSL2 TaxID=2939492 RepID=UPI0026F43E2B|nr:LPXTG cell wall anchor domain-containing protein [Nocardiopsis sp. YSL2]